MRSSLGTLVAIGAFFDPAVAFADSGEAVVRARCSLCHEGGAAGAPRIGNRAEWQPRAAQGKLVLYQSALNGKPNTAMRARGGFRDLSKDEVMSAVDYMVARAGFNPGLRPEPVVAVPSPVVPAVAVDAGGAALAAAVPATPRPAALAPDADDKTITAYVADALCELAPPGSKIEMQENIATIGGVGIEVTTREGVVVLSGMVNSVEIIERAGAIAQVASSGRKIENKLVSASIVEWD